MALQLLSPPSPNAKQEDPAVVEETPSELSALLSDYQVLYQLLRGYHWNVKGPLFFTLHDLFERMYEAAAVAVDVLAERIVALGARPPSTLKRQLELARLTEDDGPREAMDMVRRVLANLDQLTGQLRVSAEHAAQVEDRATANLLESLADQQETQAWQLRALLAGPATSSPLPGG